MAEKKIEELGVSFTLPDRPTVRQHLGYVSNAVFAFQAQYFEKLWLGALTIIEDWKCEYLPDPHRVDLDKETDPRIADVIWRVGWETKLHMDSLERVPKNS